MLSKPIKNIHEKRKKKERETGEQSQKTAKRSVFLQFYDEREVTISFKKHRMCETHQFLTFSLKKS